MHPPAVAVAIPEGICGGQLFNIIVNGVTFRVQAPPNAQPGQLMIVPLPTSISPLIALGVPVEGEQQPDADDLLAGGTSASVAGTSSTLRRRARSPSVTRRSTTGPGAGAAPNPNQSSRRSQGDAAEEALLGGMDQMFGDEHVRGSNSLLVGNRMHALTFEFDDPSLENKYRNDEFSRHFFNYVTACVGMGGTLVLHTATALPVMALLTTGIFAAAIAIRCHFHYMVHSPRRIVGWRWAVLIMSCCQIVAITLKGSRASGTMVETNDPDQIGIMCIFHLTFYFIAGMSIFGDAALRMHHKGFLYVVVALTTVLNGVPSPNLSLRVSFATSVLGGLLGGLTALSFENRSREGFLQETMLHDAMLVWRAAAVMGESGERN